MSMGRTSAFLLVVGVAITGLWLPGCGTARAPYSSVSFSTAVTRVYSVLASGSGRLTFADNTRGGEALREFPEPKRSARISLSSIWDVANSFQSIATGTDITPHLYIGELSRTGTKDTGGLLISPYGRYQMEMDPLCALGVLLPQDSSGLAVNGTYRKDVDFDSDAIKGVCHPATTGKVTYDVVVSGIATNTIYDRRFDVTPVGGATTSYLLRLSMDGSVNLASYRDLTSSGTTRVVRTLVNYGAIAQVLRFEYAQQGFGASSSYEFHRVFTHRSGNYAANLGYYGDGARTKFVKYVIASLPSSPGASVAVSVTALGQTASNGADYAACVDPTTGAVLIDGSIQCAIRGRLVSDATAIDTNFTNHTAVSSYGFGEAVQAPFTTYVDTFTAAAVD